MNVELLLKVKQAILDEPARMNMEVFVDDSDGYINLDHQPACGTVGCIAGWAVLLDHVGRDSSPEGIMKAYKAVADKSVEDEAHKVLGLGPAQYMHPLFYPWNKWPEDLRIRLAREEPGTEEYAQVVADAIDRYIAHPWGDPCNGK
jgi:hypothetical protein